MFNRQGEYYEQTTSDLTVTDVSNPAEPRLVGTMHFNAAINDFFTENSKLYVAYDYGNRNDNSSVSGLWIINATDPSHLQQIGHFPTHGSSSCVVAEGEYAYLVESRFFGRKDETWNDSLYFRVLDVSDASAPFQVGCCVLDGYARKMVLHEDAYILYSPNYPNSDSGMRIIRMTNPDAPFQVSSKSLPSDDSGGMAVSMPFVYVGSYFGSTIDVIDCSRLGRLQIVDSFETFYHDQPLGMDASGEYVYVANGAAGFSILKNEKWTGIEEKKNDIPGLFALGQNYPNPFNTSTVIAYSLPRSADVKLSIYNTLGQRIRQWEFMQTAGNHEQIWDATDTSGNPVTSGVYIAELSADSISQKIKLLLLR